MKHQLLVGHFDNSIRSARPKVTKPIDASKVREILAKYCDKLPDGTLAMSDSSEHEFLGKIEDQIVELKNGYLTCPWLVAGAVRNSLLFISDLQQSLGVQVLEPGDMVLFSAEQLVIEQPRLTHLL